MSIQTSNLSRRVRRVTAAGLLACVVVLVFVGPALAKKKQFTPYTIVPAVGDPKGPPVTTKVQIHHDGVSAEISYVTGATRRRMMKATLDIDFDPFATPSDREPFFHTFLLSLENNSSRELLFNPSTVRLVTNKEQVAYAIDYSTLYQSVGRSKNLTMAQISRIAYDRSVTLRPGGKIRKLLIFEHWVGKWESVVVGLSLETDGLVALNLSAPFRKYVLPAAKAKKP